MMFCHASMPVTAHHQMYEYIYIVYHSCWFPFLKKKKRKDGGVNRVRLGVLTDFT